LPRGKTTSYWLRVAIAASAVLSVGCASSGNTLAQDLAYKRWEKCRDIPGVQLKEIRPDGQIWIIWTANAGRKEWQDCDRRAAAELAQQGAVAPSATASSVSPTRMTTSVLPEQLGVPAWRVGDEWAYRQEAPEGASTFIWSVDRTETIDGIAHFVVRSGTRETFYRVSDLAISLSTVSRDTVEQYRPAWQAITWPLTVGKAWEQRFTEERPRDRQALELTRSCRADAEESITVPAGTFPSVSVVCLNSRTGAVVYRRWYSPHVKNMVREIWQLTSGHRMRELIAFKLR